MRLEREASYSICADHLEDVMKIVLSIVLSVLLLLAVFLYTVNNDIYEQAIAQVTQNPFPNNTETAKQLADPIEGNDTAVISNDTAISDLNNILLNNIARLD
jgi:predicted PurR-regulated permease PerM